MDVWEDNEAWSVTDGFKMDEVGLSREQAVHPASALSHSGLQIIHISWGALFLHEQAFDAKIHHCNRRFLRRGSFFGQ